MSREKINTPASKEATCVNISVGTTPNAEGIYPAFSEYQLPIILKGETHYCEVLGYDQGEESLIVQLRDPTGKSVRREKYLISTLKTHCPLTLKKLPNVGVHTRALIHSRGAPAIALSVTLSLCALLTAPHAQHHEKAPRAERTSPPTTIELPTEVTMTKEKKPTQD